MRGAMSLVIFATLLGHQVVVADEIRDALNEATSRYKESIEEIEAEVVKNLGELINTYQQRGDLDKTLEFQAIEEKFAREGILPDSAALRTIRQKAKLRFSRANSDYRKAFRKAIEAYTRSKDVNAALEIKESLSAFEKSQDEALLIFPRANRPKNEKQSKEEIAKNATTEPTVAEPPRALRKPPTKAQSLKPPAFQTKAFEYSTNNGICQVGERERSFNLKFTRASSESIYVYARDPSIRRVAIAQGILPGMKLRFSDFDSTSDVYSVNEKQIFMMENSFGFYICARIVQITDASRGEGVDSITFDYFINDTADDDQFIAPPVR